MTHLATRARMTRMLTRRDFLRSIPLSLAALLRAGAAPSPAQAATKLRTISSKSESKTFRGVKLDDYLGLSDDIVVFAMNRRRIYIYADNSTSSRRLNSWRQKGCLVVDTSHLHRGTAYSWVRVKLRGKRYGYVQLKDVKLIKVNTRNFGLDLSSEENRTRAKICRYGFDYLGTPWRLRTSFETGISCYVFCYRIFEHYGCKPKGRSLAALGKSGKKISKARLKPGDLVCYSVHGNRVSHTAIYIGKNLIINSSGHYGGDYPNGGVRVSSLNYRSLKGATYRRLV